MCFDIRYASAITMITIYFYLDFIVGLERDYPSTVSTVARTAAKLKPSELIRDEKCIICLM